MKIKGLFRLNLKTVYFNLKYLPFRQAVKVPVLISKRVHLKRVSGSIRFDCAMRPFLVQIGYGDVGIFDKRRSGSIWDVAGEVIFKGKTKIGHGSKISVTSTGILELGENFSIAAESSIVAARRIIFGKGCLLSWDVLVMDTDFHKIKDETDRIINGPEPVTVGNNVWIGCRCLILKGANIPDGCVIGAGSLVSKPLESGSAIYAGSPAKCARENIEWEV